jgi:hypothetical protein
MSAIADIFAAVRLDLQTGQFEVDAAKVAGTVGDSMSKQLSSKLKSAALAGIGALGGMAFSAALTGANQLDAATRQLQADTGMTAEEAKNAEHALAGMFRNNLQGFDQIGAAMAKVHNDLGLTGDAANAATEAFLRFSTATGQDASAAVTSFDDILDAWNLTAGDAGSVMDKLIVSHQKFGGVIAVSESALAAMAPAMTAANMSIDDGIGLLNLFNASGIDASSAAAMLQRAIKQLKPGQSLNDLIAQVGAIEDPTLRAQKAMEIFGKQGAKMAQALQPGITSLADFTVSTEEATDATDKAAAAIESGFGAKFKLLLKQASGALAEFGLNFGELAMVAAAFGPKFTTALLAGLGGLGALVIPKITGQLVGAIGLQSWMTTGTMIGTTIGAAIGPAMAVAGVAAVVAAWAIINDQLNQQAAGISTRLGEVVSAQTIEQLKQDKLAIGKAYAEIANLPFGTLLYGDQLASLQRDLDAADAAIAERLATGGIGAGSEFGKNLTESAAVAIAQGTPPAAMAADVFASMVGGAAKPSIRVSADQVVSVFGTTLVAGVKNAAAHTGIEGMLALAAGISSARQKPLDAFDAMVEMLKTPMTSTQEAARLAGELTSQSLADGLRSHDPEIRAQAIAVKREILARLAELQTAKGIGAEAMAELVKGMESKDPEIRKAATAAYDAVMDKLNATKDDAYTAGGNAGTAFGAGFTAKLPSWLIARNIHQAGNPERASGGPVSAGMPYIVGEHRPELFVPQTSGYILPSVPASRGVSVNIERVEIADAHDEFSLTQQLQFLASVS